MSKFLGEANAKITDLLERCNTANQQYLSHLTEFVRQMIVEYTRRETEEKEVELSIEMMIRKLMGKDIKRPAKEMRHLTKPKDYPISPNLEAMYSQLKTILSKRGW